VCQWTEATPTSVKIFLVTLIGAGTDSERAIRWLIALTVLCCDPLAVVLTASVNARKA
jgi:hypothetical protein